MPYIPHTPKDTQTMLESLGLNNLDELFDEIPSELRNDDFTQIPDGIDEMHLNYLVEQKAAKTDNLLNFIGAGSYQHHIPAAVWDITSRGEFLTAYTPYQAEASQGTLQLLYEYQTMMSELTGMDVSNASLYDGASALAEAVLMAVRSNRKSKSKRILIASTVHPYYRATTKTIVSNQAIELINLPFCSKAGITPLDALKPYQDEDITAIVIAQPNFFGNLESVDAITDWAKRKNCLTIGCVNPISLGLLKPPGDWGQTGADIVCGEGQPLGVPIASGGPYFGFLTSKMAHVRQMPGRIIGRTVDSEGKPGFCLTLQAREQHIRRAKATSNICTNQGLLVTAATIHMSLLGPRGIANVAKRCHSNTRKLAARLNQIKGIRHAFTSPYFHEVLLQLELPVEEVLNKLKSQGIEGGLNVGSFYPELPNCLLVCATETKLESDLTTYTELMQEIHVGEACLS